MIGKGNPADVLDHATSEIAIGSKRGIDATKKLAGEGFKSRHVGTAHQDERSAAIEGGKTFARKPVNCPA